jgi:hypothetical protein
VDVFTVFVWCVGWLVVVVSRGLMPSLPSSEMRGRLHPNLVFVFRD